MKIKYAYMDYIKNFVLKYKESDMFARRILLNLDDVAYLYPDDNAPDGLLYIEYKDDNGNDIIVVHITTDYVSKCSSSTYIYVFYSLLGYRYVIDKLGSLWNDKVICRDLCNSLLTNKCVLNCSLDNAIIEESSHYFSEASVFACYKPLFQNSLIKIKEPECLYIEYYSLFKDYNLHFNNLTLTFSSYMGVSYSDNYKKCFDVFEELLYNTHFTFDKLNGIKLCSLYLLSIDEFLIHLESHLSNLDSKLREILMKNHPKIIIGKEEFYNFKSVEFKDFVKNLEIINSRYGNLYDITDLINVAN